MRIVIWILLLCCPALAGAAETRLSVVSDARAPLRLWVAGAESVADRSRWIAVERDQARVSMFLSSYVAELAAGSYAVVGISPIDIGAQDNPVRTEARVLRGGELKSAQQAAIALRTPAADEAVFTVGDAAVDLGLLELHQQPTLALALRMHAAAGWQVADPGHAADADLRVMRQQLRWIGAPTETADGQWVALASGNRLLIRGGDGRWQVRSVMRDGRPVTVSAVGADSWVVGGEAARLEWIAADGAERPLSSQGLPFGLIDGVHCDSERRCVVAVLDLGRAWTLFHSADALRGDWVELQRFPAVKCGWSCNTPAQMHRLGDELVVFGGVDEMLRIRLDSGQLERSRLPFKHVGSSYSGGRLAIGERYSDDGGRSWQPRGKSLNYGALQFDRHGDAYFLGMSFDGRTMWPVLRRVSVADGAWKEVGRAPAQGTHALGSISDIHYLQSGIDIRWSADAGRSWQPDFALYAAFEEQAQ
jgi:hypothetical protein